MKILLDIPDDKASTILNFLKSISYVKAKPLNYSKGKLIDEISEAFEHLMFDESFGKVLDYNVGDIVVWRGNTPAIGRVKKLIPGNEKVRNDPKYFFHFNETHQELHPAHLRYATDGEIKLLGDSDVLLLDNV